MENILVLWASGWSIDYQLLWTLLTAEGEVMFKAGTEDWRRSAVLLGNFWAQAFLFRLWYDPNEICITLFLYDCSFHFFRAMKITESSGFNFLLVWEVNIQTVTASRTLNGAWDVTWELQIQTRTTRSCLCPEHLKVTNEMKWLKGKTSSTLLVLDIKYGLFLFIGEAGKKGKFQLKRE